MIKKCILLTTVSLLTIASLAEAVAMEAQHIYCVILAGGSGERLWPLSRQHKPKQLLEVGEKQTLLDQAIDRVQMLVPRENIWVCTTQKHAPTIEALCGNRLGRIIAEPGARNTGPAILLSCFEIAQKDPEAVVVFLPADPFIPPRDNRKFAAFLEHAIDFTGAHDNIALLGVQPTFAATGYGYIEFSPSSKDSAPYKVLKFHEKPSQEKAQQYLSSGSFLWNIGIFCGRASVFINEFKHLASAMYEGVLGFVLGDKSYDDVPSDSIDYAIMEKSTRVSVLPVNFSWCDVGNIEVFLTIKNEYGSLDAQRVVQVDAHNNLVDVPDKVVALIGVDDLCVVQTESALLITKRSEAEKVRAVVKQMKHKKLEAYL